MLFKLGAVLLILIIAINAPGIHSQQNGYQLQSKTLNQDAYDLEYPIYKSSYDDYISDINKRAYVRLAGKRALVRLGKRAYVRLGKRRNELPEIF
uniref:Secreted protein n=1 Tax=Parastrongyloides trichosuri TaxID=131310 RepID=A0A0N4ZAY4_PARTI